MNHFKDYAEAGFGADLLPILPPDAEISPASESRENLEKSRGKVPGRLTRDKWVGFGQWPEHQATPKDHEKWDRWQCGAGLQGRNHPGLDIDVEDAALAQAIETEAILTLGFAPCRFGNGERRLLVYAAAGLRKRRLAFRIGQPAGSGDDTGAETPAQAVELLGLGQFFVIEGVHPKTGRPYHWRAGAELKGWRAPGLTEITAEDLDLFFERIEWMITELWDGEITAAGSAGGAERSGVAQDGLRAPSLDAVTEALAAIENDLDYDDWFKVAVAVKASTDGSAEGKDAFLDWSGTSGKDDADVSSAKYDSARAPFAVGWGFLSRLAAERSGGEFNSAAHDFDAVPGAIADPGALGSAPEGHSLGPVTRMFNEYAWVEGAKRAVELKTGDLLDQEQFEFRLPPMGDKNQTSPWKTFKERAYRRKTYKNLTFRPGQGLEVDEDLPDLEGVCLNIWREPRRRFADTASDNDIAPWLELAAHVIPNDAERNHVFDFLAFTVQHPGDKIHHALVLGSRNEGVGKDTLIEPLRWAIGRKYVREIGPQHLGAAFNAWVVGAKLAIVQEMHNFERRETMNRLKPYVAAPPLALPVNMKHRQEFFVPNLLSMVFFTNEEDALALSSGDRRYFVCWNDADPQPKSFYDRVWDWLRGGGIEQVGRWLMDRDVSSFNAKGRAPETAAKEAMRKETRPPLQEWVEEGIANREHPFDRDLVLLDDVARRCPEYARFKGAAPTPSRVAKMLQRAGARPVTDKIRIPNVDGSRIIWAVRRAEMYGGETSEALRGLFMKQREESGGGADAVFAS